MIGGFSRHIHLGCRTHCQFLLPTHSPGRLGTVCHQYLLSSHSPGRLGMVCHQYRQCWGLQLWLFLPPGSLSPPPPHLLPHLTVIFRGAGFLFTWTTLQLLCICMHVCFVCVFVCVVCVCMYICAYAYVYMLNGGAVSQNRGSTGPHCCQLCSPAGVVALALSAAAF